MNRRDFILNSSMFTLGTVVFPGSLTPQSVYASKRPALGDRKFSSPAIEDIIKKVASVINDPELAWMFGNCFPNTLDTTVEFGVDDGKPDTFVITGDINAMWLRDSTAQVWPYLPFVNEDEKLRQLILGLINRQAQCILIDPYANAFNKGATGSEWEKDMTAMKPELHERKWEIDSLCYPVRLAYHFFKETGDRTFFSSDFEKAARSIVQTFKEQQRKEGKGPYRFMRLTPRPTDTVPGDGYGNPVKPVGLICSIFRPSDDSTIFPFLIPSNYFAVKSLRQLAELFAEIRGDTALANECGTLADEVEGALKKYAVTEHLDFGEVIAFEVDGFGNRLFMDDSNIPSLLALPYLGCIGVDDPLYRNTRRFVLSGSNPWFFKGEAGEGIGGPHIGEDMIWPMSIIMRAMTSNDESEIYACLKMLKATHGGTGFMHESFHKDDPKKFTRKWFAWANTLFGELVLKVYRENSPVLQRSFDD